MCFTCSFVRSVSMDKWKDMELEKMKAGGNRKARQFFESQDDYHEGMSIQEKYNSKAAALYRDKVCRLVVYGLISRSIHHCRMHSGWGREFQIVSKLFHNLGLLLIWTCNCFIHLITLLLSLLLLFRYLSSLITLVLSLLLSFNYVASVFTLVV